MNRSTEKKIQNVLNLITPILKFNAMSKFDLYNTVRHKLDADIKTKCCYRTFSRYCNKLAEQGKIRQTKTLESKGNSTIVSYI